MGLPWLCHMRRHRLRNSLDILLKVSYTGSKCWPLRLPLCLCSTLCRAILLLYLLLHLVVKVNC